MAWAYIASRATLRDQNGHFHHGQWQDDRTGGLYIAFRKSYVGSTDPRHYGGRIKSGDADHILMLWKGDSGVDEVIYSDLNRALIPVDQLLKLEKASQNLYTVNFEVF